MLKRQRNFGKKFLCVTLVLLISLVSSMYLPLPAYGTITSDISYEAGKRIAAGGNHVLALKPDCTIVAWGNNDYDQCTIPEGLNDVVDIAAGESFSLALKADGTVVAWGKNDYGQCTVPADLNDVIAIGAGGDHAVALKSNGKAVAWGRNGSGQCSVPIDLADVTDIAVGSSHNLAIKNDGTVRAWGWTGYDVCAVPEGLANVQAVSAGASSSMALLPATDLTPYTTITMWGRAGASWSTVPEGLMNVVSMDAGNWHTCALLANGTITAWGENNYGQCNVEGYSNVLAIDASRRYSLALQADGSVLAWGLNDNGQCDVPTELNLAGRLQSLSLNTPGPALPALDFHPDRLTYTAEVINSVTSIELTASLENPATQQLFIQGEIEEDGKSKTISLDEGANPITLEVQTPTEGLTRTYTLTVNRAPSDATNAALQSLETNIGTLSPAFDPAVTAYSVDLNNNISNLELIATPEDSNATVAINGNSGAKGLAHTVNIPIDLGKSTVHITVTSQDSTTKAYEINFYKLTLDLNADTIQAGKNLTVSGFSYPNTALQIDLNTADANSLFSELITADEQGNYSLTFPIPKTARHLCTITATTNGDIHHTIDKELLVKSPKKKSSSPSNENEAIPENNANPHVIILTVGGNTAILNDQPVLLDSTPFIHTESSFVMLPLRFIFESLGATVNWLPANNQINITRDETSIILWVNANEALINGQKVNLTLGATPYLEPTGRTFLPMHIIKELLGAEVAWEPTTGEIRI